MDAVAFVEKLAAGCSGMKIRKPVSRTSKPGSMTNKWAPGHRYQGATTKTALDLGPSGTAGLTADPTITAMSQNPLLRRVMSDPAALTRVLGAGVQSGAVGAAAVPGAVGAGIGGLAGLINPGEDEQGQPRSRLWAGLKGVLGGGAIGAGAGLLGAGSGLVAGAGGAGAQAGREVRSQINNTLKAAFAEKLAAPNALTGNLGGVFQGSHGSGLLPPSPAGGVAPNVVGGSPSVTGASVSTPKPKLTPPAPAAAPKMPQLDVPPPNPGSMPGGTAVPGAAGPTVAQKPVDVSAPGMMDKSHIAPTLTAQFDMQRAQQMGMHADGMPVPAGPAGRAPAPMPPPGLVKTNAAEAWGEMMAKQIGGKHRVRTLEEYDAKPGDFARRLAEAGA